MIGYGVVAVGWVVLVVGLCLVLGLWPMIPAGAVMVAVGLLVDLEPGKGPTRGKRT